MLEAIFGNKTAQLIFLRLFKEDSVSAGMLARDFQKSITAFQQQLEKFENAGLLVSKKIGNVRFFSFNPQSSYVKALKDLIEVEYRKLDTAAIDYIYRHRMRPRKRGKRILNEQ